MSLSDASAGHRQSRDELPAAVVDWLRRGPGEVVAIMATTDADGSPRTAAFGALRAVSSRHLRFSCRRTHSTYFNIIRDGRVMVALYGHPDIALGIRGQARVIREQLADWPGNAVIGIDVTGVKNDQLAWAPIASGITYDVDTGVAQKLETLSAVLEAAEAGGTQF